MIANNNNHNQFVIGNYIDLLGEKRKNGKFKCPNCGESKLSIKKDGQKYTCYGCYDQKAIAYKLRELNGEFNGKSRLNNSKYINTKNRGNKSKLGQLITDIERIFPDLRFNEHDHKPWLDDQPFEKKVCEPELLHVWLAKNHNLEHPKEKVIDVLLSLAKDKPFNPLEEYLEQCRNDFYEFHNKDFGKTMESANNLLSNLSSKYFGTNNHLYNIYLKNWLLSAVGRAYHPGCYTRSVLILQGKQNIGKSTFFSILGGDLFSDSLMEARNKDELMIAHSNWILEWQELETIWGKKSVGRVKAFISASKDSIRLPYARSTSELKRKFVLCGTTNQKEFLTDKTGNSRFWVIPCNNINLSQWEKDKDSILGALAVLIHYNSAVTPDSIRTGKLWELNGEVLEASEENTHRFEEVHPFEETIDKLIEIWDKDEEKGAGYIIASKIWDALGLDSVKERPRYNHKIGEIMRSRGYESKTKRIDGKPERIWKRVNK